MHKHTHTPSPQRAESLIYQFLREKGKRGGSWASPGVLGGWESLQTPRKHSPHTAMPGKERRERRKEEKQQREREEWRRKGGREHQTHPGTQGKSGCLCALTTSHNTQKGEEEERERRWWVVKGERERRREGEGVIKWQWMLSSVPCHMVPKYVSKTLGTFIFHGNRSHICLCCFSIVSVASCLFLFCFFNLSLPSLLSCLLYPSLVFLLLCGS